MDPNVRTEQKVEVVDTPGQRREIVTERTERSPENTGLSSATIALIAVLGLATFGVIVYLFTSKSESEFDRNANLAAAASQSSPQQAPVIIQQPAPAQAPIIIQQPAPAQQAPVIIEQPAAPSQRENTSANDDANMQDIATKRLIEEPAMAAVLITINDARAILTGTVSSAAAKVKAEQLVKSIRGVKSVDNKIEVTG
jgi:BON domain